jgi:hypothetical protein
MHAHNRPAFTAGEIAYHKTLQYCVVMKCQGEKAVVRYQNPKATTLSFITHQVATKNLQLTA